MSRIQKTLERLKSKPRDFTWRELQSVMAHFDYKEIKGSGSRRKFISQNTKISISLHEPHPQPSLKQYAIELVIEHLREEGYL
jgi:HicA toxin of bacterial toxin-antitoxin,